MEEYKMTEDTIPVIVEHIIKAKGMVSPLSSAVRTIEDINIHTLSDSFSKILVNLNKIADVQDKQNQNLSVAEINISLEIDAKAGFVLVGTASTGTKSTIQVTLRPQEHK